MDFQIIANIDNFSCLGEWFTEEEIKEIVKNNADMEGFIILQDGKYSYVSENVFYACM